jgi:hypothetical protein
MPNLCEAGNWQRHGHFEGYKNFVGITGAGLPVAGDLASRAIENNTAILEKRDIA